MVRKTSESSQNKSKLSFGEEINCPFDENGCNKKLPESLMLSHEVNCCYNFKKYGKFVNLCKLLGYFNCGFLINNGNVKAGIEHFQSEHNFILTNKSEAFQMILSGFQKKTSSQKDNQSWTPIILDLKDKLCHLLIVAVTDKAYQSVALSCIFLPYPNNDLTSSAPLQMEFSMPSNEFTLIREPMSLSNAEKYFEDPDNLQDSLLMSTLSSEVAKDGSLTVNCQVKAVKTKANLKILLASKKSNLNLPTSKSSSSSQTVPPASASGSQSLQTLPKIRRSRVKYPVLKKFWKKWNFTIEILLGILIVWAVSDHIGDFMSKFKFNNSTKEEDRDFRNLIGKKKLQTLDFSIIKEEKYNFKYDIDRNEVIRYIHMLLDDDLELPWAIPEHRANLRKNAHFFLAANGDVKAIHYLVERGFDVNAVDLRGLSVLDWTLHDRDPFHALEKVKCLIETYGADYKKLNGINQSYLHRAAWFGNYEAVEYFLNKGLSPDDYDTDGNKPIHVAVWKDREVSVEIAKLLLERAGIEDCFAQNRHGATPLHLAKGDTLVNLSEICDKS